MSLTLHVGLSKKAGLPNFGSIGASCQLEVELENSLLQQDLETFQQHVRRAYVACAQAVNDELARHLTTESMPGRHGCTTRASAQRPANFEASHDQGAAPKILSASPRQLEYAEQLAAEIPGLGAERLDELARERFGKPLNELSRLFASGLIDLLKDLKAGRLDLEVALPGEAA